MGGGGRERGWTADDVWGVISMAFWKKALMVGCTGGVGGMDDDGVGVLEGGMVEGGDVDNHLNSQVVDRIFTNVEFSSSYSVSW